MRSIKNSRWSRDCLQQSKFSFKRNQIFKERSTWINIRWWKKYNFFGNDVVSKKRPNMLQYKKMNFAKKQRGRKPTSTMKVIPSKVTRWDCVSRVSEILDLTGDITLLTAAMELVLHNLVITKLDWDETIPDNLWPIWDFCFQLMNEIKTLIYQRAVISDDAVGTNVKTLDFGDAGKDIAYIAIYARFKGQNSSYSC